MAVDQKKVIDEALSNIQSTLIDKGGLLADLPKQLSELAKAQEELSQAQEEYNEAMRSGTDEQKEAATKKLNDAQKRQQNAQVNVQKSTDKTTSNLVTLSNVITQLGSNSEISLSQVGDLAGNIVDIFAEESEKLGGIIGAAFSLLDAIGTQGLDGFVGNIFSSVFKSVGGIWDTLTFGGFSKLFRYWRKRKRGAGYHQQTHGQKRKVAVCHRIPYGRNEVQQGKREIRSRVQ